MFGLFERLGAGRNQDRHIRPVFAVPFVSLPMAAPLGFEDAFVLKMQERVDALGAFNVDVSSLPAVTPAGPSLRNTFFPPEGETTVSAIPSFDVYFCTIDKQ